MDDLIKEFRSISADGVDFSEDFASNNKARRIVRGLTSASESTSPSLRGLFMRIMYGLIILSLPVAIEIATYSPRHSNRFEMARSVGAAEILLIAGISFALRERHRLDVPLFSAKRPGLVPSPSRRNRTHPRCGSG